MIRVNNARVSLQPAYVLHRRPYRDSSLLLELFTPEHGRVGLVARGARAAKSRLHGALQPFQPLLVSWAGRGELATLCGAEAHGPPPRLDGQSLISGFYLNELLLRLLARHDAHPALFAIYQETLSLLATEEQRALRIFEKHLLKEIGYALVLSHEVENGASIEPGKLYRYRLEQGPVQCEGTGHGIALHGASLLSLMNEQLSDEQSLREVKALMRAALALYLGDKPLQSRALLINMHKTMNPKAACLRAMHGQAPADAGVEPA
jgi:DNA repair protein RecO (recombination protein O)